MQQNSFTSGVIAGACACIGLGVAYTVLKGDAGKTAEVDPVEREQADLHSQKDRAGLALSESKSVYFEGDSQT